MLIHEARQMPQCIGYLSNVRELLQSAWAALHGYFTGVGRNARLFTGVGRVARLSHGGGRKSSYAEWL